MIKFLLDSGDPDEFKEIYKLAKKHNDELWGATTNPTLIAKKLAGKKITQSKAFELQKQIVLEIISILPGAVSAEVYADGKTKAQEMIEQGREISKWHKRVVVKLPTNIEGFKARTVLRQENIPVNNTLVFSQEQVFAICLHEKIIQHTAGPTTDLFPPFISPFVGRLDDIGIDGMMLVENSMKIKKEFNIAIWMLEASVRQTEHIKRGLQTGTELITCPSKLYNEWFSLSKKELENLNPVSYAKEFKTIDYWSPSKNLLEIDSIEKFMQALDSGKLNIYHPLTEKGIARFADDWKAIISE